jgi:two-component system sensor histidine kinase GlrK
MSRLSFSHVLLASFLLIVAILGSAALGGLAALESFAVRSHADARDAVALTAALQQIRERTIDMERSARQYMVLGDAVLLTRFNEAREAASEAVNSLGDTGLDELIDEWRVTVAEASDALTQTHGAEQALEALARATRLNELLTRESRAHMHRGSQALLSELDDNRRSLGVHVLAALIVAAALALLTGWWVLRPLKRVEAAIENLGASRFDEPVVIDGPADLRHVGRRLDWLRLRLADFEANRSRVLRHVSHELKTPLASLREGIALMEDGVVGAVTPAQREVITILNHNVRTLQQRIEGLLGFNAAIFDAHSLHHQPLNLRSLIQSVVAEQQLSLQTHQLQVNIEGADIRVLADPDKMQVVLSNLLVNAVSFSPPGGTIHFRLSQRPGWVTIDCLDEGVGIADAELGRVFEPFFQGQFQPEQRSGSGLGLSIVREFITAHGGTVEALPHAGGAFFRIELPHEK